ncbi:hypothetical protein LIPSTDRAFT_322437 [Lipomyces starkeyi NRRL Y-11557]|uniref:Uncharacterized protein n=1 Tax=Lipomyces starkeyi NRRL Y-11557 TaxID=675824 RepID=A0A1E3Q492_LIPST|nr:hypothetical protein LIPSTDRAFT_322437 [Lipomyces starkeyi NRRL Y-11557]
MIDCEVVLQPVLEAGAREIILIIHDEYYLNSNDDNATTWTERGESVIKKKGQGLGLMVSDFYCTCHGPYQTSRVILEPGKTKPCESWKAKRHENNIDGRGLWRDGMIFRCKKRASAVDLMQLALCCATHILS